MHVAELPGIQVASLAMPDMHWGYGFPIGGVAAFDARAEAALAWAPRARQVLRVATGARRH